MSNRAWVTLATNDSYGLGALVLAHSLRGVNSLYPAVVLITPSVTESMRERLRAVFAEVIVVDVLDSRDAAHLALLQRPELGITFTKIHCWNLTQYEKCVFLDADTLIVQNCDELFEREQLSAAPDVGWPDCFNSGVFVFSPSAETFNDLITFAKERGSFDGGDQGLLNSFFSDWARGNINKHLPFLYNVTSAAFYSYLPALKHFGQDLKIIHFIGAAKPWLQQYNFESGTIDAPDHIQGFLQHWWDVFVSQVHCQLDTGMSGVAGNLARVLPGATGQREALDELTRRQGWEAGNIDYMGADSFDNIWAKISQTLNKPRSSPPKQQSPPKEVAPSQSAPEQIEVQSGEVSEQLVSEQVEVAKEAIPLELAPPVEEALVSGKALETVEDVKLAPVEDVPVAPETSTPAAVSAVAAIPLEAAPVKTVRSEPIQTAPIETAPAEAVPVTASSETLPVKTAPAETAPVVSPPVETALGETAPIGTKLVETAPVETAVVETAPVETKLADTKPFNVTTNIEIATPPEKTPSIDIPLSVEAIETEVSVTDKEVAIEAPVTAKEAVKVKAPVLPDPVKVVKQPEQKTEISITKETGALPVAEPVGDVPIPAELSKTAPVPSAVTVEVPATTAVAEVTPEKPTPETAQAVTDSPPLLNTPSKEEVPAVPAAKSEERRKPAGKLKLVPPVAADPLPTPDSELEDAAALAQSIIAGELRTPTVTSPGPAAPVSPLASAPVLTQGLSVEEPQVPTPPVGAVSLSQIGVKSTAKGKSTTAAQIASSVVETPPVEATAEASAPTPADVPKKKLVKKVVKKDAGATGADAPVPPPRKKEKKPKEK